MLSKEQLTRDEFNRGHIKSHLSFHAFWEEKMQYKSASPHAPHSPTTESREAQVSSLPEPWVPSLPSDIMELY